MSKLEWRPAYVGFRLHRWLPVTVDSLVGWRGHQIKRPMVYCDFAQGYYISKPSYGYADSLILRIFHAWLVLTNQAGAVQYSPDHIKSAQLLSREK